MESVFGVIGFGIATIGDLSDPKEYELHKALSLDGGKNVELVNVRQLAREFNCTTKEVMKVLKHDRVITKKHGLKWYAPAWSRYKMKWRNTI